MELDALVMLLLECHSGTFRYSTKNIEVIDNALDKVKQLKGITYDLKSDGNNLQV